MGPNDLPLKHIAIVAGEHSGDLLGANLINDLKDLIPNCTFEGIGGPLMIECGLKSLYPIESLSVIGLTDVFKIANAFSIRSKLSHHFSNVKKPDIFIGIDVPDFNLGLEEKLKNNGIKTVQYVSPQVWAWRGYRVQKIHRSIDHMLTLFPFEENYYREQSIPVTCVGHPLSKIIEENADSLEYRRKLLLPEDKTLIAMLPGSRNSEIKRHAQLFFDTFKCLNNCEPEIIFVFAFVSKTAKDLFWHTVNTDPDQHKEIICNVGQARDVMAASDEVLVSSGTATLEAALLAKPMVVTYKVSTISYQLMKRLSTVDMYALANHLYGSKLVPEFLQDEATPENLANALLEFHTNRSESERIINGLKMIRKSFNSDKIKNAAVVIKNMIS